MSNLYTPAFYDTIRPGVQASAAALVPYMADIHAARVTQRRLPDVVDVGCGEGWWGLEWVTSGAASKAHGIDGPWGGSALLADGTTASTAFFAVDLDLDAHVYDDQPEPYEYDIALCLEVAEHLYDPDAFLAWLRRLAPFIFFSAAVPGQPGAGHINCRWQSGWAASFHEAGWHTIDPRRGIWDDGRVEWWYRQNLFVAYDPDVIDGEYEPIMSMVHPEMWAVRHDCR